LLHVNYQCYGGSKKKNPRLADIIASMAAQIFVTLALERKTERETERKRERQVREKRLFRRRGLVAGQTFPADCTGVSLPLRLLLFVYYNLDTIISPSSSRPSWPRYRRLFATAALYLRVSSLPCLPGSFSLSLSLSLSPSLRRSLDYGLSRVSSRSSSRPASSSKCWCERGSKRERAPRGRERVTESEKENGTEIETYNKVPGRVRRVELCCVVWCAESFEREGVCRRGARDG